MAFFKALMFGAALSLSVPHVAQAQTLPDEVLQPYKDYRKAIKAGDERKAIKFAEKAWEAAEEALGDNKTTGDLAQNYADALAAAGLTSDEKNSKKALKAYKRSISLSSFYGDDAAITELDRRIIAANSVLLSTEYRSDDEILKGVDTLMKATQTLGTPVESDVLTLKARGAIMRDNNTEAAEFLAKALSILETVPNGKSSMNYFTARALRGQALLQDDRQIESALQFQEIMQNLEGTLPAEHPLVDAAFGKWLGLMGDFTLEGTMAEAIEAGVCECWPYDELRKDSVLPMKRVPPIMPYDAYRSGWVTVKFDVDKSGRPENIETIAWTDGLFRKPSVDSVKKWVYTPYKDGDDEGARSGVVNKISFRLSDESGNIIPEPEKVTRKKKL